jgi:hypothetical protein
VLLACDRSAHSNDLDADTGMEVHSAAITEAVICTVLQAGIRLPVNVRESSGLARGIREPTRLWTHNDRGNEAELFAVGTDGRLLQTVRVTNAAPGDWEDLEAGPCRSGTCLFAADIGDNEAIRESIAILEIPEPAGDVSEVAAVSIIRAVFPDRPRDAESLFLLPTGDLHIVSKGREGPITIFRLRRADSPSGVVVLEPVRQILPQPSDRDELITAATATPDGRWVGIRSYRTLFLYRADDLLDGSAVEPLTVDLTPLREGQGEGLAIDNDGSVWLSSEAASPVGSATMSRLQCALPGPAAAGP